MGRGVFRNRNPQATIIGTINYPNIFFSFAGNELKLS
jgi:hypothetical protein